jgi:hypothetical protein
MPAASSWFGLKLKCRKLLTRKMSICKKAAFLNRIVFGYFFIAMIQERYQSTAKSPIFNNWYEKGKWLNVIFYSLCSEMHQKQDQRRSRLQRQAELHGKRRDLPSVEQQLAAKKHRQNGQLLSRLQNGFNGKEKPQSVHVPQLLPKSTRKTKASLVLYH